MASAPLEEKSGSPSSRGERLVESIERARSALEKGNYSDCALELDGALATYRSALPAASPVPLASIAAASTAAGGSPGDADRVGDSPAAALLSAPPPPTLAAAAAGEHAAAGAPAVARAATMSVTPAAPLAEEDFDRREVLALFEDFASLPGWLEKAAKFHGVDSREAVRDVFVANQLGAREREDESKARHLSSLTRAIADYICANGAADPLLGVVCETITKRVQKMESQKRAATAPGGGGEKAATAGAAEAVAAPAAAK